MSRPKKGQLWVEEEYEESEPIQIVKVFGEAVEYCPFPFTDEYGGRTALLSLSLFKELFRKATVEEEGLYLLGYSP